MNPHRLPRAAVGALCVLGCLASTAGAVPTVVRFDNPLTTDGGPLNVAEGPDGKMWFTYATGSASGLARVSPSGVFEDLSSLVPQSGGPWDIVKGPDGNTWVTESTTNMIARITPGGTVDRFPSGSTQPLGITAGPDGRIWYTLFGSPARVGSITTAGTGQSIVSLPLNRAPNDITSGPDGNIWVSYYQQAAISTIAVGSNAVNTFTSGLTGYNQVNTIIAGPDGALWLALRNGSTAGALARVTPATFPGNPGIAVKTTAVAQPLALTTGADGRLWYADQSGTSIFGATANPFSVDITLAAGAQIRGMARDSQGNVWAVGGGSPGRVWRVGLAGPVVGMPTSQVGGTAATIQVPVNGNGQATSVVVSFGVGAPSSMAATAITSTSSAMQSASVQLNGLLPATTYTYRVRAINGQGTVESAAATFTTGRATPTPPSTGAPDATPADGTSADPGGPSPRRQLEETVQPVQGKAVLVEPSRGTVMVRLPGTDREVPLADTGGQLPVGTDINAERGAVELTSSLRSGETQTGRFWGARFRVGQAASGTGVTTITIDPRPLSGCSERRAVAGARELGRRRPPRRELWAHDQGGLFRTQSRNSVATVRGTTWVTTDTCEGTTTRVTEGAVSVRDLRADRTVVVRAGQRYLARRR